MARGKLRIYLGAAPGVGKTFAMLNEGRRRQRTRGTDVVVGFVETHGRANTAAQIGDLEVVPRRRIEYRGHDLRGDGHRRDPRAAARRSRSSTSSRTRTCPGRATRSAGRTSRSCSTPGIDVISTVNIQHLESLNDVVEAITGIEQRETIPDEVVRARRSGRARRPDARGTAAPHGARQHLRAREGRRRARRTTSGSGNLGALRELALMWVADRVDEALEEYRELHGISGTWETRERVVVAITGAPGRRRRAPARGADGDADARRAARRARAPGRRARRTVRPSGSPSSAGC